MFGFLNIYKPKGKTSHDIVAILRRITKMKQIGHTGTLDPFAEGVLPICIGKSTRLIEYLDDDKAYIGTVKFGSSTDTYDLDGKIVNTSDKKINIDELNEALNFFRGEIEQKPPIYSALKVNGKKLYEYARNGEEVEVKSRKVTISRLELLDHSPIENTAKLLIECSKGTYIRSIANDLGEKIGCYGHLIKLERIKAGKFLVENSIKLENIINKECVEKNLLEPLEYLDYPSYDLNSNEKELISHGMSIKNKNFNGIVLLKFENKLVAVAEAQDNIIKCSKVFI